jgi:hypothetical protein
LIPYGNVIDPFIDRGFGHHFDPASEWDRSFIDEVHRRDEAELASGRIKPTHMIAVVANEPSTAPQISVSPESCLRSPDKIVPSTPPESPYDWNSWPHDRQTELEIACRRLAETGREIKQRTAWALGLQSFLEQRTAWALSLEQDVEARTAWARRIEKDSEIQALAFQALVRDLQTKIADLEQEIEDKSLWALSLKQQLAEQTARAECLDLELYKLIHNPLHLAARLLTGIRNRFRSTFC